MTVAQLIEVLQEKDQDAKVINKYTGEPPEIVMERINWEEDRWDDYECIIG